MSAAFAKTSPDSSSKSAAENLSVKIQLSPSSIIISGLQQKGGDMHGVPRPVRRLLCFLSTAALVGLCITTYFVFFHRGSTSSILEQNRAQEDSDSRQLQTDSYEYFDDEKGDKALKSPAGSVRLWNAFIRENKFVAIGDIYDTCEEKPERLQIGKTILFPDERGALETKTFLNFTLKNEISEGAFQIDIKYNNKDLYKSTWNFCTVDKNNKQRVIYCPIRPGFHRFMKIFKVPGFIPKGVYKISIQLLDQDDKEVLCSRTRLAL